MRMLVATDYLVVLSLLTPALGDYEGYSNYVYPETYSYTDNTSLASYGHHYHNQPTERSRRTLDEGLLEMEGSKAKIGENKESSHSICVRALLHISVVTTYPKKVH